MKMSVDASSSWSLDEALPLGTIEGAVSAMTCSIPVWTSLSAGVGGKAMTVEEFW